MDERKIDFALLSSTRKVRGEGKTARDRAKKGGEADAKPPRRRRSGQRANFEPDSAFRSEGDGKRQPAGAGKGKDKDKAKTGGRKKTAKPQKNAEKTRKIAAATRAKRASKKKKPAEPA